MSVLSALGLAAAAVCLAALSVLLRERRVARDGEALIARTESPSVLTDIEGGIIAANAAMQWRAPGARRLASLFAAILRGADDALLYRMARDARANGCAHAVLPGGPDGSGRRAGPRSGRRRSDRNDFLRAHLGLACDAIRMDR